MDTLITHHTLINNTRIAYGVHGYGPPVVLIHGTPSSSFIWRGITAHLTDAGYAAHVYDLLGYGLSERPWDPRIDTSVSGQVPILEGILEHLGIVDAHIVAHDIGGGIAQRFALAAPKRVRSLTLIDTVSFDSWPSKRTRQQMHAGLDVLMTAPDADHRTRFADWLLSAVEHKHTFKDGSLGVYLEQITNPVGQASLFQHQVRHYEPRHTADIASRLAELSTLPVQLLWGAQDAWQDVSWAYKLQSAIPGSELHVIQDCGHFAMEDQPDRIAELVIQFLRKAPDT